MTGPRSGKSHPHLALKPVQVSDGMSWSSVYARRDDGFKSLQTLCATAFMRLSKAQLQSFNKAIDIDAMIETSTEQQMLLAA